MRSLRRSFTLTELMVAVAVLIVVIIATSKIFGTASKITGLGQATASLTQEAAAIEKQIRADFERLSQEGFFAIHCVAVRNDVKGLGQPLLNPNLPSTAIVRADQLVFFTNGVSTMQTFRLTQNGNKKAQAAFSRVYWGPAFQLGDQGRPAAVQGTNVVNGYDPIATVTPWTNLTPWTTGAIGMNTLMYATEGGAPGGANGNDIYGPGAPAIGPTTISNFTQPEARQWLLARQSVALMDDDDNAGNLNSKTVYLGQGQTARSIFFNGNNGGNWGFSREIRNGRLDGAASEVDAIRKWVLFVVYPPIAPGHFRVWSNGSAIDQRSIIQSAVYYPRAERRAPSMNRIDQALTNHVIGGGCSSFIVDWTYDNGVGALDINGDGINEFAGVQIPINMEQPWFGMNDASRGVYPYSTLAAPGTPNAIAAAQTILPLTSYPNNIESSTNTLPTGVSDYWALFGYNQTRPLNASGNLDQAVGYTPFPTGIRVTMTLHDPEGKLEGGREFQFVIRLPRPVS